MAVTQQNDEFYLDAAIKEVTEVLTRKRQDWATGMQVFECFDAQKDFGDDPLEFALKMCNLKMTRLRSCVARRNAKTVAPGLDRDLEDTIKDLAGYALLALGLYKREQGQNPQVSHDHTEPLFETNPDPEKLREWLQREQKEQARKSQNSEALGVSGTP